MLKKPIADERIRALGLEKHAYTLHAMHDQVYTDSQDTSCANQCICLQPVAASAHITYGNA